MNLATLYEDVHDFITHLGRGQMSGSAYDTSWLARLGDAAPELSEPALEWLRANQLPDGSWGTPDFEYFHERLICTLAAMIALQEHGSNGDRDRLQRATDSLPRWIDHLDDDLAGPTIGFELLVPTLLDDIKRLGFVPGQLVNDTLYKYAAQRTVKMSKMPNKMVNRHVTMAFSCEMVGKEGLKLLDADHLQEANGSVAYSPAATSFFAKTVRPGDPAAIHYLTSVAHNGSVPNISPIDVFEIAWSLSSFYPISSPENGLHKLARPYLEFLKTHWQVGQGIGSCAGMPLLDGDTTGVVYEVLHKYGQPVDIEGVFSFRDNSSHKSHFLCFPLENDPSVTANIHILGALSAAGYSLDSSDVNMILDFLERNQIEGAFWIDKWHVSPYYPTTHAIIAMCEYDHPLLNGSIQWILENQKPDGSWGYYISTAEETAYCLQALSIAQRAGHEVPQDVITRGANWLGSNANGPYPMLWIGKSLYCPTFVVRSVILSTLLLVQQGA